jgi:hypothetical protein
LSCCPAISLSAKVLPTSSSKALLQSTPSTLPQRLMRWPRSIKSSSIAEALRYLERRGLHDPALIKELRIGYAPGGCLRRHLTVQGYSFDLLRQVGLVNSQGRDTFYGRVVFPAVTADALSTSTAAAWAKYKSIMSGMYNWGQCEGLIPRGKTMAGCGC